jgi:general secretion pathway protein K
MKMRGTAIITALFITTLVAIAATAMALRFRINLSHTEISVSANKMSIAREAALLWAYQQLRAHTLSHKQTYTPIKPLHLTRRLNGTHITATLEDAQQFFNINVLQRTSSDFTQAKSEVVLQAFQRLLRAVDPTLDEPRAWHIAFNVASHLHQARPSLQKLPNAIIKLQNIALLRRLRNTLTTAQPVSYAPLYHPSLDVSDIRDTPGMTPALYARLKPYLIALPNLTPVNLNTASTALLFALSRNLSFESLASIEQIRGYQQPIESVRHFLSLPAIKAIGFKLPLNLPVTVYSQYFRVTLHLHQAALNQSWQALLQITPNARDPQRLLWQRLQ